MKLFRRILLVLLVVLLGWGWHERENLRAFPDIISAYTAKEYCSCRYVMNNDAEHCRGYVKQWLPSELTDDRTQKTVTASGLGRRNSAQWQGERQGCRLNP